MEELGPEDLEELVQELKGESGEEEALSPEVEELLRDLQPARRYSFRRRAAKQLGEVSRSSRQVVQALVTAAETDSAPAVRATAAESLRVPVHQEVLQRHPDLREAAGRALQQGAGAGEQFLGSDTGGLPAGEEVADSFLSRAFHDPRWKWAPVYAVFLLVTIALVFAVDSLWALGAAGVVWVAGSVLGMTILHSKGYSMGGEFGIIELLDYFIPGCSLVALAPFALAGPVILLVALFKRPQDFVVRVSMQRAKAKDTDRIKSGPAGDRNRPSDCPACGAWNAPDSEHCTECGVALKGVDVS